MTALRLVVCGLGHEPKHRASEDWTDELLVLLRALARSVDLQPTQDDLLDEVAQRMREHRVTLERAATRETARDALAGSEEIARPDVVVRRTRRSRQPWRAVWRCGLDA